MAGSSKTNFMGKSGYSVLFQVSCYFTSKNCFNRPRGIVGIKVYIMKDLRFQRI